MLLGISKMVPLFNDDSRPLNAFFIVFGTRWLYPFCHGKRGMSKKLFDRVKIGSIINQPGGQYMPESMEAYFLPLVGHPVV